MELKIFLIAVHCCVMANTQQFRSTAQCQGPPIFNCNCASSSQGQDEKDQFSNIRRVRPGRVRRVGPNGQKVRIR